MNIDIDTPDTAAIEAVAEPKTTPFVRREKFDPANEEHLASFKIFIETGNWGDVQFHAELPFIEVPMTVLMKFAGHHLNAKRESASQAAKRIAAKNVLPIPRAQTRAERIKETETRIAAANELLRLNLAA